MAYGGRGLQVASVTVSRGNESDGDVPACASAGRLQGSPMTAPIPRCAIARPRLRVSDVSIRVGMPGAHRSALMRRVSAWRQSKRRPTRTSTAGLRVG